MIPGNWLISDKEKLIDLLRKRINSLTLYFMIFRETCFLPFQIALESRSAKLATLAVSGLQVGSAKENINPLSANPNSRLIVGNSRWIVWVCLTILRGESLKA